MNTQNEQQESVDDEKDPTYCGRSSNKKGTLTDTFFIVPASTLYAFKNPWSGRRKRWRALKGYDDTKGRGESINSQNTTIHCPQLNDPMFYVNKDKEAEEKAKSAKIQEKKQNKHKAEEDKKRLTLEKEEKNKKNEIIPLQEGSPKTKLHTSFENYFALAENQKNNNFNENNETIRNERKKLEVIDVSSEEEHKQQNKKRFMYRNISIFDPVLAEIMYKWFCPLGGRIFDPFSGGSTRGLVAGSLGYEYTGIDLSSKQVEANLSQLPYFPERIAQKISWNIGNSTDLDKILGHQKKTYDFVFTCPPYYDMEMYSKDPNDLSNLPTYPEFLSKLEVILEKSVKLLKNNRFFAIVLQEDFSTKYSKYCPEKFLNEKKKKNKTRKNEGVLVPFKADVIKIMQGLGMKKQTGMVSVPVDWK